MSDADETYRALEVSGYPYSVSEDYLQYQIWDTLQAFASSMTGALATEAVLKGAGVGDQVRRLPYHQDEERR